MATEIDLNHFTEQDIQDFQSFAWSSESIKLDDMVWTLDEKGINSLTKSESSLDTGMFFVSPDSSPISSPYESIYSSSPTDSSPLGESDYQPPENSSSDEENAFSLENELANALGLVGEQGNFFTPGTEMLFDPLLSDLQTTHSAFQNSCLPPLPIAEIKHQVTEDEEEEEVEKKTKKRRRNQVNSSTKLKAVKFEPLSPEELLKLDSNEIEEYIRSISATRSLAPSEEKELKRVRRLIKNREYAQSSRNKKKQYMEEMEKKISDIAESKVLLQKRVEELEQENKVLKTQLSKIGAAMKRDPSLLERLKEATRPISSKSRSGPQVLKTGVVLFMVALSFGLFFNPSQPKSIQGGGNNYNTYRKLLWNETIIPEVVIQYAPDFVLDFAARYLLPLPDSMDQKLSSPTINPLDGIPTSNLIKPSKPTIVRKLVDTSTKPETREL